MAIACCGSARASVPARATSAAASPASSRGRPVGLGGAIGWLCKTSVTARSDSKNMLMNTANGAIFGLSADRQRAAAAELSPTFGAVLRLPPRRNQADIRRRLVTLLPYLVQTPPDRGVPTCWRKRRRTGQEEGSAMDDRTVKVPARPGSRTFAIVLATAMAVVGGTTVYGQQPPAPAPKAAPKTPPKAAPKAPAAPPAEPAPPPGGAPPAAAETP